ncbi:DNA polymerase III subunit gamma and tau [Cryobacterium sp. SO1]|uniref:DNA polymerase III subunit gamma and tau n=1 Tax=Cryobacterium sp. SO1 TaxID=1897061 RepID=UPI0010E53B34|nr:DNA polymerase III subunit gamma/tau [Cryobacterium sp. SO1]
MIGQSQVTDPLMTALRTNRVNHAYLFSGPRGCGKTTSARILARCLNCAEGPTDTPCGVCPSCVELSRDGSGSLDVVEIDAASHNGVDDARDIRERAIFAPARDRYKIFILDEAHMVTPQGFNALLKIVEEPPEHVKFIFATTEPEKVIGTIRSRTHHYPFRLVPPAPMLDYVQTLCDSEHMTVAPGVLPLVVRAGGGSPRDTLSLLDQLMAGSETDAIEYERAVALLGYTHATLLDDAVDAIAARNSSAAFDAVDRVIQTGQDPRRFVEDLLERMRDLIIVAATSAAGAAAVLRGVPQDELDRMQVQASKFGPAELSRSADILNAALTEMTGATSPRLHLELMIARVLIPATDDSTRGALARVERLERRIGVDGGSTDASTATVSAASAGAASGGAASATRPPAATSAGRPAAASAASPAGDAAAAAAVPAGSGWATRVPGSPAATPAETPAGAAAGATTSSDAAGVSAPTAAPGATPAAPVAGATEAAAETAPIVTPVVPVGPVSLAQIKDAWPQILEAVKEVKLSAWLVVYTARVLELRGEDVLVLSFPSEQDMQGFKAQQAPGQGVSEFLRGAIVKVLGLRVKFIARADSETFAAAGAGHSAGGAPAGQTVSADASPAARPAGSGAPSTAPVGGPGANSSGPSADASAPSGSGRAGSAPADSLTSGVSAPSPAAADATSSAESAFGSYAGSGSPSNAPSGAGAGSATSGAATATATRSATATLSPPATSTGWATVVIPGSAAALAAAETLADEPVVAPPTDGAAVSVGAPAAAPATSAAAAPSAALDVPASSAPTAAPQASAPSAPGYDFAPEPDFEPPFDEEPPPYDDLPPDPQHFTTPVDPARGGRPNRQQPSAPQQPRAQQASDQAPTAGASAPGAPAASAPASQRGAPARRSPAFAEKQRYGEAVVREILGATFIEEQPHDPISRQRNDN